MSTQEEYIHWRIGGKIEYCGVEILPEGKDIEYIVIESIKLHKKLKVQGSEKENIWVAYFKDNKYTDLPWILNTGSRQRISMLSGEESINRVKNLPIRLTKEKTKDKSTGDTRYGLRVSRMPAKSPVKETLTLTHPKFADCKKWLEAGNPIDGIKEKYNVSKEVEAALNGK